MAFIEITVIQYDLGKHCKHGMRFIVEVGGLQIKVNNILQVVL